ncbi:MAG: hydroxymethylglutaryl-CoA lyase [Acidimicrobiia bacterium]|nr:hydroxymethylglutaryl-CoA lyase [Acidimicrobiia bacterium]
MNSSDTVLVTESISRDGLQSLGAVVPTEAKVHLIRQLISSGLGSFDAVSFVNPKVVPNMADGTEVIAGLADVRDGVELAGLVPNLRGLEAAVDAGVDTIGLLTAASDTFNLRNINATVEEAMERIRSVLERVPGEIDVRAYVSTITHCPYEGPTDPARVAELTERLIEWGVDWVYLGETLGRGTPDDVERVLNRVFEVAPPDRIGVHFHDTFGQGVANTHLSLQRGIRRLDSSAGGLGGCPFAPGAAGNVATEDVLWLLDGMGLKHGVDATTVARAARAFAAEQRIAIRSKANEALLAGQEVG